MTLSKEKKCLVRWGGGFGPNSFVGKQLALSWKVSLCALDFPPP